MVLLIILLTAGPWAANVPLAALAGVLVVVCYHMSEWHSFKFILSGTRSDILVLLTTFLLTVFVDLTMAVGVGLVLASFLFMRKMAELSQVKAMTREKKTERGRELKVPKDVEVYAINGSLFFGAAEKLMELDRAVFKTPRVLILDMSAVLHMDTTGLKTIRDIRLQCQSRKTRLILAGVQRQPMAVLHKAKKVDKIGKENFMPSLEKALKAV